MSQDNMELIERLQRLAEYTDALDSHEIERIAVDAENMIEALTRPDEATQADVEPSIDTDDIIGIINIVTDLDEADALDLAVPVVHTRVQTIVGRALREAEALARRPADEVTRLREALHEIDILASNTIPPDGKEAAYEALGRIIRIINPFRLPRAALSSVATPNAQEGGEA